VKGEAAGTNGEFTGARNGRVLRKTEGGGR